jgi:6-phosphogluconolactonase (cycloisomerase 2 family)
MALVKRAVVVALLASASLLSGCGNFFVCEGKSDCPVTTTPTSSGDYAFVANTTASTSQIAGYELSTGTPLTVPGSPFGLDFVPNSMVVTPDNTLLFVSSAANAAIYSFAIAADGALSSANGGTAVGNESAAAMDISPDGKYLFVLNSSVEGTVVDEFAITATTGVLTAEPSLIGTLAGATATAIKVAPSGDFVVIALGSAGDEVIPLVNELFSGAAAPQTIQFTVSGIGDFGVTVDANNNIYFARTGQVAVYSATSTGVVTAISNTTANSTTGSGDHSIVLNNDGTYVYTGNATTANISGFSSSSGTLAVLSGSPYAAPTGVDTVALDSSGKYILAAGYGTAGFREYTIGTLGALTASSTTGNTGTTEPLTVMAVTH